MPGIYTMPAAPVGRSEGHLVTRFILAWKVQPNSKTRSVVLLIASQSHFHPG